MKVKISHSKRPMTVIETTYAELIERYNLHESMDKIKFDLLQDGRSSVVDESGTLSIWEIK